MKEESDYKNAKYKQSQKKVNDVFMQALAYDQIKQAECKYNKVRRKYGDDSEVARKARFLEMSSVHGKGQQ